VASDDDVRQIVDANNGFAMRLYGEVRRGDENLFFSPLSINTALAMASVGARGKTLKQMTEAMQWPAQDILHPALRALNERFTRAASKKGMTFDSAFAFWGQKGISFRDEFSYLLKHEYGAGLQEIDFSREEEARKAINDWVSRQTKSKITELVRKGDVDGLTVLYLASAINFQGAWENPFDPKKTKEADFELIGGKKVRVPLMQQKGFFRHLRRGGLEVLDFPFAEGQFTFFAILPDKPADLDTVERSLNLKKLNDWLEDINPSDGTVMLPRFKLTAGLDLKTTLGRMGMEEVFTAGADFSGIAGSKDVVLTSVVHKAALEVNEAGAKASASTGIGGSRSVPYEFRADRPFIFLIRERRSGCILFMGRLMRPA